MDHQHCIDICNKLLRGERSAVETYDQAIEKFRGEPASAGLHSIRMEHVDSVSVLEANVRGMGGTPEKEAGAWGTFANAIQGTANFLGEGSAIASLQSGEKTGKSGYEDALDDEKVMPACKEMIRATLLPRLNSHIASLDQMAQAV